MPSPVSPAPTIGSGVPEAVAIAAPIAAPISTPTAALTRFEGHCLCQRVQECEALLQLAVIGVERALECHLPDRDLVHIAHHLAEAEKLVEVARRLAARWGE